MEHEPPINKIDELLDVEYEAELEDAKIRAEENRINNRKEYENMYKYLWCRFKASLPLTKDLTIIIRKDRSYDYISVQPTIYERYAIDQFTEEVEKKGYKVSHREQRDRWNDAYRNLFFEVKYIIEITL